MSIKTRYNEFKRFSKPWGGHHILPALIGTLLLGPLANASLWIGKEFGEATERAGGTKEAIHTRTIKSAENPDGVWEPWDAVTPALTGYVFNILFFWVF